MEYEDIIKRLGTFGKYQKRILIITFLPTIYISFGAPVSNFLLGNHSHRCKIPDLDNDTYKIESDYQQMLINETIPLNSDGSYKQCYIIENGTERKCSEWVYDISVFTRTVNSQFNLVCDDVLWHSHATTTYFFGYLVSSLFMAPLADIFGRRIILCLVTTLQFAVNIAMPFSPSVYVFALLRFMDGFCGNAYFQAAFIIGMELVGPNERLISGTAIMLVYTFGELVLVFIAYFIRDWKWLQFTLAVPMAIPIVFWWPKILPESPRWLISRGRTTEALVILRHAANVNNVTLPDNISKVVTEKDEGVRVILKDLFRSREIIIRWVIIVMNWFIISLIYYALTISIGKLGGNLYVNFTIAVVVEAIGYSLCFLLDLTGRKPLHLTIMYGSGIACLASIFPTLYGSTSLNWLMIMLSMVGKLGVSAGFGEIFIYTGELFPTVVRSFIMGICSTGARIGSTISPYMYVLADGKMREVLPLIIYGVLTFIVATLSITLPETKRKKLLEKVKDIEKEDVNNINGTSYAKTDSVEDVDDETSPL